MLSIAMNGLLRMQLEDLGGMVILGGRTLRETFRRPFEIELWMEQFYQLGVRSLTITNVTLLFTGMVLAIQTAYSLAPYGGKVFVGDIVALSVVRELGPVLTALLFAGRAGTAITAEIGLMRATNQIEAMELMAIDPVQRIALPRFSAGVISLPLLTAIFNAMAILGAVVFSIGVMDIDTGTFWGQLQTGVYFQQDLLHGMWKSIIFGGIVSLVAVYFGYYSEPTGAGVGTATTNTVVLSSVFILIFDFILTSFLT